MVKISSPLFRDTELNSLQQLTNFGAQFVYIHGNAGTGKTTVLKYLSERLSLNAQVHIAMFNARFFSDGLELCEGILNSCKRSGNYGRPVNYRKFVDNLSDCLDQNKSYNVILDDAHTLKTMDLKLFRLMPRLSEVINKKISVFYVSNVPWFKFRQSINDCFPVEIHFSSYSTEEMLGIMGANFEDVIDSFSKKYELKDISSLKKCYSFMCEYTVQALRRSCNDISELIFIITTFFPCVVDSIANEGLDIESSHNLHNYIQQFLKFDLIKLYTRETSAIEFLKNRMDDKETDDQNPNIILKLTQRNGVCLPLYSKYLLVSAFLASYNTPQTDVKFFSKSSSRSKRGGGRSITNQVDSLQLGPKQFSVERMLAIFYNITDENIPFSVDISIQLATLISMGYLNRVSGSMDKSLTTGLKCKCNVNYVSVKQIAESLSFPLDRYLHCL